MSPNFTAWRDDDDIYDMGKGWAQKYRNTNLIFVLRSVTKEISHILKYIKRPCPMLYFRAYRK